MVQNITSLTAGGHIHPLSAPASAGTDRARAVTVTRATVGVQPLHTA